MYVLRIVIIVRKSTKNKLKTADRVSRKKGPKKCSLDPAALDRVADQLAQRILKYILKYRRMFLLMNEDRM